MLAIMKELEQAGGWSDMKLAFGYMLGLEAPVTDQVLARARGSEHFAVYLLRSRGHDKLLNMLMNAPATCLYPLPEEVASAFSTSTLTKRVVKATWKWAASGFKRPSAECLAARLKACRACGHLTSAPKTMLYQVALVVSSDPRICGLCGCIASRKALLKTENCPMESSRNPGYSLWGEPIRQSG